MTPSRQTRATAALDVVSATIAERMRAAELARTLAHIQAEIAKLGLGEKVG